MPTVPVRTDAVVKRDKYPTPLKPQSSGRRQTKIQIRKQDATQVERLWRKIRKGQRLQVDGYVGTDIGMR